MKVKPKSAVITLDAKEIRKLANEISECYRAMVLIAAWAGARWGEIIELRRKDIELVRTARSSAVHRQATHYPCNVGRLKLTRSETYPYRTRWSLISKVT